MVDRGQCKGRRVLEEQFSIITVSYNEEKRIVKTIESVLGQKYTNFEYIIVDGKSEDDTVAIIDRYADSFSEREIKYRFFSERDTGVYNAMNKAIKYACGKYTLFLNAGDVFENENVLLDIADNLEDSTDVLYGSTRFVLSNFYRVDAPRNYTDLCDSMPFCHQSVFTKTELLKKYGFDEQYRISADYDFFIKLYKEQVQFVMTDIIISIFTIDGLTYSNYGKDEFLERTAIRYKYGFINEKEKNKTISDFKKIYRGRKLRGFIRLIVPNLLLNPILARRYVSTGWTRKDLS